MGASSLNAPHAKGKSCQLSAPVLASVPDRRRLTKAAARLRWVAADVRCSVSCYALFVPLCRAMSDHAVEMPSDYIQLTRA